MNVTILGPNLRGAAKGTFHVHATGCADIERDISKHGGEEPWTFEAASLEDIANSVYGDMIDEGSMTVQDALDDIWVAPCLRSLK